MVTRGQEPLVDPVLLRNEQLGGGLTMFFFQYLLMMGVFFLIPLYLSVALGLSAIATGVRIMPMSLTLLAAALGVPRLFPDVSPRLVVRVGILLMLLGLLVLLAAIDIDAGAEIVTVPLLLVGLGLGALASQLGAVTVSAVPDEQSSEVGGLQNTVTNLGASLGTALAGSILIAVLTASFLTHIEMNNAVPQGVKDKANIELAAGIPFMSDKQLEAATKEAGASSEVTQAALDANAHARLDGLRAGLTRPDPDRSRRAFLRRANADATTRLRTGTGLGLRDSCGQSLSRCLQLRFPSPRVTRPGFVGLDLLESRLDRGVEVLAIESLQQAVAQREVLEAAAHLRGLGLRSASEAISTSPAPARFLSVLWRVRPPDGVPAPRGGTELREPTLGGPT